MSSESKPADNSNQSPDQEEQEEDNQSSVEPEETVTGEADRQEEEEDDDSDQSSQDDNQSENESETKRANKDDQERKKNEPLNSKNELQDSTSNQSPQIKKKNKPKAPVNINVGELEEFKSKQSDDENQKEKSNMQSSQMKERSMVSGKNMRTSLDEMSPTRRSKFQSFVKLRTEMFKVTSLASLRNEKEGDMKDQKGRQTDRGDTPGELYNLKFGDREMRSQNKSFKSNNKVRTQRYSALTWAPLSLIYQFKRIANIYFLLISILTCLPFSPKDPSSMIGTFAFVLVFTMLKEAYEDYQRYLQDKEVNNKLANVLNPDTMQFELKKWEEIEPGDIVKFKKDQEACADLAILFSSNQSGVVYVDSMNLDGETNLKEKIALLEDFDDKKMSAYQGELRCDNPNQNLDKWDGKITFKGKKDKPIISSIKNLLLRGCYIKNTAQGVGIVVYTGMNTKIMKNLKKQPHKVSNIMRLMNKMLYSVFAFQLCLIIAFAASNAYWVNINASTQFYLNIDQSQNKAGRFFIQLLVFWVAYSHLIPISLYVIIEILKLGLASFVNKDVVMYDEETESFARCRNSDLIEELGQVEMVFSDKTGTLTQNKMIFKKCQINGIKYGEPEKDENDNHEGMVYSGIKDIVNEMKRERRKDPASAGEYEISYVTAFLENLALCNTVMCEREPNKTGVKYKASSPDELALAIGSSFCGVQLVSREHDKIKIQNIVRNEERTYQLIAEFPFDSVRKRMSVILRDDQKQYMILTKGADSVMLERISYEKNGIEGLREMIEQDLYNYSCEGLRTLMIAQRGITQSEFNQFNKIYTSLVQSESTNKEEKLFDLYDAMEHKLRYLGSTAIEDKLQEGVQMTIERLMQADIRFFMLTGDKLETAIEIAKSCKVIQDDMNVVILCSPKRQKILKKLQNIINVQNIDIYTKLKTLKGIKQENQVITIDGSTLTVVLEDDELAEMFFHVSIRSKSIVCCRMSPLQKSEVVRLFKSRGSWITLAIGDGANDVSMIMEAHIGVGVKGKEGTQAVRSADFAISQFHSLLRLLLFHGRYGYMKVSQMICYYFYKNIVLVFTEYYFAIFNGFSGQIFFLEWLPTLYNAIFTSWCCLFTTLLEKDLNADYSYKYPVVYKAGQLGLYFNFKVFWKWILLALWHGVVCFFGPLLAGRFHAWDSQGHIWSHWVSSTISFTFIIHLVLYKLLLETRHLNWISVISGIGSIIIYYVFLGVGQIAYLSELLQPQLNGIISEMIGYPYFWLMMLGVPLACLVPDIIVKLIYSVFYANPVDVVLSLQMEEPEYNFRLHIMNKEIKLETKRRQTAISIDERKYIIEEKKKSVAKSMTSNASKADMFIGIRNTNHKLDQLTENMTSGQELRNSKQKEGRTNGNKHEQKKKQTKQPIEENMDEDEQTDSDDSDSSNSSNSGGSESQDRSSNAQEDHQKVNKSSKKKGLKVADDEDEESIGEASNVEKSNRSHLDHSVRSERNLIKKNERIKEVRDQRKLRQQQEERSSQDNQIAAKAKKGGQKLKPPKNKVKVDDHSMFSVSTVPSNIEPKKKSDDPDMEYFENLGNVVAKRKDGDQRSNESEEQRPQRIIPQAFNQIDKSAFKKIVSVRSTTPELIPTRKKQDIVIPKSIIFNPCEIVDNIIKERPQTQKNDFMYIMGGHPLESSKVIPHTAGDYEPSKPINFTKKQKKYVEKYKDSARKEQESVSINDDPDE